MDVRADSPSFYCSTIFAVANQLWPSCLLSFVAAGSTTTMVSDPAFAIPSILFPLFISSFNECPSATFSLLPHLLH